MPIDPDQPTIVQQPQKAYSWTQGAASMVDPLSNMIKALAKGGTPPQSGYEGNIASPANPYNSGVYGMPSSQPSAGPAPAPTPMQASPPPAQPNPVAPWGNGMPPPVSGAGPGPMPQPQPGQPDQSAVMQALFA